MSPSFLDNLKSLVGADNDARKDIVDDDPDANLTDEEDDDDEPSRVGSFIGHVLFKTPVPDMEALAARLPEFGFAVDTDVDNEDDEEDEDDSDGDSSFPPPLFFKNESDGLEAISFFAPMPPVPQDEVEYFASRNYFWPDGEKAVGDHQSNLIVSVIGSDEDDPIDAALRFVMAVTAALQDENAIGVYLNNVVYAREQFLHYVATALGGEGEDDEGEFPIRNLVWCSVEKVEDEEDKVIIRTYGCECFGHKNMEVRGVPANNDAIFEQINMLTNVAAYVITENVDMQPGETFGYSETDKRQIEAAQSLFDEEPVLLLETVTD